MKTRVASAIGPACLLFCLVAVLVGCAKSGPKVGDVKINPKDGAEMVWVPAGKFKMGTSDAEITAMLKEHPDWEADWFEDEKPQHEVELDGYWMYKHEVTVAQYRKFCRATNREMPDAPSWGGKDDHPIANVRWHDAADYAKWAGVRLPTEAEWDKAARGTDGRRYVWGNQWPPPKGSGNFADETLAKKEPELVKLAESYGGGIIRNYDDGHADTAPVGSFPAGASPYGCLDMAGNMWEWCADWYGEDYYKSAPAKNPGGPASGQCRVLRGGSWGSGDPGLLRAPRRGGGPGLWYVDDGFRCAASAPGLQE